MTPHAVLRCHCEPPQAAKQSHCGKKRLLRALTGARNDNFTPNVMTNLELTCSQEGNRL
jgi:hypothetical protein